MNFALHPAMELMAAKLGIDPLEFRVMNSVQPGQSISTGRIPKNGPIPEVPRSIPGHYRQRSKRLCCNTDRTIQARSGTCRG